MRGLVPRVVSIGGPSGMSVVPWETGQWIELRTNTEDRQYNSNISERSAVAYG